MTSKMNWQKRLPIVKVKPKVRLLSKKDKLITPMLHNLLTCVTPHPNYVDITTTIKRYIPKDQPIYTDKVGNLIVKVGNNYTTMFSCHIDMVFSKTDFDELPKKLDLFVSQDQNGSDAEFIWGGVIDSYKDNVYSYTPTTLGADDKAGIFLLLHLICAKVPGLYIFHIGEEIGGIGSLDIKLRKPGLVKNIKRAIAFDRMDYTDIINRQRGSICCSNAFVTALAEQLNDLVVSPYKLPTRYKSATGTFTDTANYVELIPECTNISVGYENQHSAAECLDTFWLETVLLPAVLKIDWEALPTERSVSKPIYKYTSPVSNNWSNNSTTPIRKYTQYADINYNTPDDKLPPWTMEKGNIKSCSEVGMRRLIKHYLNGTASEFTVQQQILNILRENTKLKEQLETTNIKKIETLALPKSTSYSSLKYNQKLLFTTLTSLTYNNFSVYKDNYYLYDTKIADYAETLKWAWDDVSKFEGFASSDINMIQQFATMKEILSEILVINTTLIAEINYDTDGIIIPDSDYVSIDLVETIAKSIKFFKHNWFHLGYDTYAGVQDEFRQIRDKITATD